MGTLINLADEMGLIVDYGGMTTNNSPDLETVTLTASSVTPWEPVRFVPLVIEADVADALRTRGHTRIDDSFVAYIAAPIWWAIWRVTFGRFGKPLWRYA